MPYIFKKSYFAPIFLISAVIISFAWYLSTPAGEFAAGNYFFGGGAYDLNLAQYFLKKAVQGDGKFQGAHYQLSRVYFIKGDFNHALEEINKEIINYTSFNKSYYVRGLILGYTDRLDLAVSDFKRFLSTKPESWAGHNDLAWVYFKKGDFKSVEEEARAGLAANPANPWLLNSLGLGLLNQGKNSEAEYYFKESEKGFDRLGVSGWGVAYPGNDPAIYKQGFSAVLESVKQNQKTATEAVDKKDSAVAPVVVE